MFILGVGTSPGGKARVGKSNTMNAGVGGGRPLTSPAPGSVGRRSTISYDQAKTSSSSTERTNEVPRYSDIQLFLLEERGLFCAKGRYLDRKEKIIFKWRNSLYILNFFNYIFLFVLISYGMLDA